jgi:hypothetical protein
MDRTPIQGHVFQIFELATKNCMTVMQNTLFYDVLIAYARPIPVNELGGDWFFIEEQGIGVTYCQSATVSLNWV